MQSSFVFSSGCIDFTMCPYLESYLNVKFKGTSDTKKKKKSMFSVLNKLFTASDNEVSSFVLL